MPEAARETKLLAACRSDNTKKFPPQRDRTSRALCEHTGVRAAKLRGPAVSDPGVFRQACKARVPTCEVEHSVKWNTLAMVTALTLVTACNAPSVASGPLFGTGVFHPPPKPGDSIGHTQMCECKACDPSSCCEGPEEDDAPPVSCGDSYDFSSNPSCGGLAVRSCQVRCTRQIWRVHVGESCASKRPLGCCTAG
jgi:hypothetical protein